MCRRLIAAGRARRPERRRSTLTYHTNTTATTFANLGSWTANTNGATTLGSKISGVSTSHTRSSELSESI